MFPDLFGIPGVDFGSADIQIFDTKGGWATWNKPRGKATCAMVVIGSAAGGASGNAHRGTNVNQGGGGGGGSAAAVTGLGPLPLLPDRMYVQCGLGGAGGPGGTITTNSAPSGTSGSVGAHSYLSLDANTTTSNILIQSGSTVAAGGVRAVGGSGQGGGGAGGTASAASLCGLAGMFALKFLGGQAGAAGGSSGSAGGSVSLLANGITTGGAGAGGFTSTNIMHAGGSITGTGIFPTLTGPPINVSTVVNGITRTAPTLFYGGCGGSGVFTGANPTVGGNGGNGAVGCGGGAGGGASGSSVNVTSGNGGNGGDGLVIIICW